MAKDDETQVRTYRRADDGRDKGKETSVALNPSHAPTRAPPMAAAKPAVLVFADQSRCTQAQ